jgi:hypothetical protein
MFFMAVKKAAKKAVKKAVKKATKKTVEKFSTEWYEMKAEARRKLDAK